MNPFKEPNTTLSGMLGKLKMIQTVADNIANASTAGYKRKIPESINFKSVLDEAALKDSTQGSLKKTNNKFDIAIEGNAYFLVESENGPKPVRNGRLRLNENGAICTHNGEELIIAEKTDKEINLAKSEDITINEKGEIFVSGEKYGRLAMQILDSKPVTVHQGYVESSNVNVINEMATLAMIFRSFEASEKVLGMLNSADRDLIEKYGRNV